MKQKIIEFMYRYDPEEFSRADNGGQQYAEMFATALAAEIEPKERNFEFQLGQLVDLRISEEWGEVQARAQYLNGENQYLVYYQAADKCATQLWYSESQLTPVEDDNHPGMPVFGCVELPEGATVED